MGMGMNGTAHVRLLDGLGALGEVQDLRREAGRRVVHGAAGPLVIIYIYIYIHTYIIHKKCQ